MTKIIVVCLSTILGLNPNDLLDLLPEPILELLDALLERALAAGWRWLLPRLQRGLFRIRERLLRPLPSGSELPAPPQRLALPPAGRRRK